MITITKTHVHSHFPSVSALVADCDSPMTRSGNDYIRTNHLTAHRDDSWHGMAGGAAACRAALVTGHAEGQAMINTMTDKLVVKLPRALGHGRTKRRGDTGDEYDIHAARRGAHDKAWSYSARTVKQGTGLIRLCVDIGGDAAQSADALRWRGIAGVTLTRIMEKAGYSVEMLACFATTDGIQGIRKNAVVSVVVKPRNARADVGLLSATVTLSGFFRSFGFSQLVRCADAIDRDANSNLGKYLDVSGVLPVDPRVTTLFVPQSVRNEKTAAAWVNQSINLLQHSTMNKEAS